MTVEESMRVTDKQRREIVTARLEERLRSDARFQEGLARLQDRFISFLPLNSSKLAAGIPIDLVIELAKLARAQGLDRLAAPWFLVARCAMDSRCELSVRDGTASLETWRRYGDWFFDHFRMGRSLVSISFDDGYSLETVEAGVRGVSKLLRTTPLRGRPRREHFAS
jgi:hypothetical protein